MYTQADLDALDRAIAQGVLEVTSSNGRSVRYRSLAEMKQIRADIARSLSGGPRAGSRVTPITISNGYN